MEISDVLKDQIKGVIKCGVYAAGVNFALGGRKILWLVQLFPKASYPFAVSQGILAPIVIISAFKILELSLFHFPKLQSTFNERNLGEVIKNHPVKIAFAVFAVPISLSMLAGSTLVQAVVYVVPTFFIFAGSAYSKIKNDFEQKIEEFKQLAKADSTKQLIEKLDLSANKEVLKKQLGRIRNQAARGLHPDKNPDEGKKMRDLNALHDELVALLA